MLFALLLRKGALISAFFYAIILQRLLNLLSECQLLVAFCVCIQQNRGGERGKKGFLGVFLLFFSDFRVKKALFRGFLAEIGEIVIKSYFLGGFLLQNP